MIYLDYNATTPVDPIVAEAMLPYLRDHFGNPSSSHALGRRTREAVDKARRQVADLIGCSPTEIVFTSGGSESNNFAIKGIAEASLSRGRHIITSSVEHPAVTEVCRYLENHGYEVTYLPVDEYGRVNTEDFGKAIRPDTVLVTIMHANNEVGALQPITEISRIAHRHNIPVHTDAAQSIGKVPVRVNDLGVDLLSIAAHKLYAPKGIGALYIRDGVKPSKQMHGADHESNRRAGTENVLEIVGLGEACRIIKEKGETAFEQLRVLRDRLETGLRQVFPKMRVNGHPTERLPNTASVSFEGLRATDILSKLSDVAASAGAACHSDGVKVSSVLKAMGVPEDRAVGTLRLSVGRFTTAEEIDVAIRSLASTARELRKNAGM